ncbi:SURF1 family protein [Ancylobacter sp. MQZ15Z-1]|uniref:SURF1-like protein n=1 Tax=Ancylobacter mangrovi TaxID=2972472 RepID=A0A9X2T5U2_9HYPH|nr:SURF1 family protein [Ancylobacter mangrovi]MCS0495744.1 SURF1 family protein [Ancylobacter mangrovi]
MPARDPLPRRGRGLPLVLCALFALVFTALGVWQVQRLSWKLDLIHRVETRIHAEPGPPPSPAAFTPDDAYRRVRLTGHFLNGRETLAKAVTEFGGGFWVVTPFVTDEGFTVLVNRGFVPPERRSPDSRGPAPDDAPVSVTGLIRLTEPGGAFLRSNDPQAGRWYSRDVAAIASARGLGTVAPYFVDAEAAPGGTGYPVGGLTVVRFANNHLSYALTWFALAAMSVAAGVLVWRRRI